MPQPNLYSAVRTDDDRLNEPLRDDAEPDSTRDSARERSREAAQAREDEPKAAHGSFGTSYLRDGNTDESWQQWRQIQAEFVDDPRNAVSEAHGLVSELVDGIVRQFESERTQLEQRWSSGEDVSTEDLRRCLQRYRDFFGRLLATSTQGADVA